MSTEQQPAFHAVGSLEGSTPVIELFGELDLSTVGRVQPLVEEALGRSPETIVFDLKGLSFMDSTGIALLLGCRGRAQRIELRNPSSIIRQVIEMTGLSEALVIV
jgi:anti-anti-sigma factor